MIFSFLFGIAIVAIAIIIGAIIYNEDRLYKLGVDNHWYTQLPINNNTDNYAAIDIHRSIVVQGVDGVNLSTLETRFFDKHFLANQKFMPFCFICICQISSFPVY